MRANLVPACANCNSGAKGSTVIGDPGERLIHPYFDVWADEELWLAAVRAPFEAATFEAVPLNTLDAEKKRIVKFHLDTVLATQFNVWVETRWSALPAMMTNADVEKTTDAVGNFVAQELKRAVVAEGRNGWNAALMRGILSNEEALAYLTHKFV